MDKYLIDGHKIHYHQDRLAQWMSADSQAQKLRVYPIYVEISPVGHCNHRCTFCAVDYIGYVPRILETHKLKDIIAQMGKLGVRSVMFAGEGEPLLHKNLPEIINNTKMNKIDVAITTNGTMMTENFVTSCLDSISWIKVSCNAGDEASYKAIHRGKDGDWQRVWDNLSFAVTYRNMTGLKTAIGIQTVILPENLDTIEDLVMEAKLCGIDYIVLKPYSQHLSSEETAKKYGDIKYDSTEVLRDIRAKFSDDTFDVVLRENAIEDIGSGGHDYSACFSTPYFWSYLMSDGSLYACSAYLLDERFNLGNINEQTFQQIWEGEKRAKCIEMMETLDISRCRLSCRMNQVNKYLWDIKNPRDHKNFI